jgi:hypothetical protein
VDGLTDADAALAAAAHLAGRFVREETGFAQLTTIDRRGYPVTRTMTAFLLENWWVATVQRQVHRRVGHWQRHPQTEVLWVGSPRADATNERPHVFDIGRLPPRLVSVRGDAELMPPEWTEHVYRQAITAQRAEGNTLAPVRTPEEVASDLVGVRIRPVRVRLEGFGDGAQSFTFDPQLGDA